ncbi:hypothetical protein F5B22DRAFT_440269 [Xylaria bambusicola]|uniref:uncharacterized protein n=1 Tax=Xylaria bambusicola TaxID=326684 RepID=UPI002007A1DD|nr:uncharacterized protein F5B22DRAFT_440269 [Xylaria bambusicola]KAI0506697.1 hypothetical protein F5B22DRAFT_440269 [Xylaria bambusicola]
MANEVRRGVARPRLYHTKSRTGCARCRSRRVKCDETRPVCHNCHRHNVSCEYDRVPNANMCVLGVSLPSSPPSSTSSRSTRPSTPALAPNTAFPGQEVATAQHEYWKLRVFHHFAVATSGTLAGSHIPAVKDCWSSQVPILALDHRSLLNAILAISALHLISSGHSDHELRSFRAMSLNVALEAHREALSLVRKQETADAACFTSILLLVDAFASLRHRPLDNTYQPPMQWLRLTHGVRCVIEALSSLVQTTGVKSPASIMPIITSFSQDRYLSGRDSTGRFSHLLQPLPDETPFSRETLDAYREAVNLLDSIEAAAESREPARAISRGLMSFACLVPAQFLQLVETNEPRALVILAHLFALCAHARDLWWVGDTPYREVIAIGDYLPLTMKSLVEWPQKLVTQIYILDKS